jgi:hypothetical protein
MSAWRLEKIKRTSVTFSHYNGRAIEENTGKIVGARPKKGYLLIPSCEGWVNAFLLGFNTGYYVTLGIEEAIG